MGRCANPRDSSHLGRFLSRLGLSDKHSLNETETDTDTDTVNNHPACFLTDALLSNKGNKFSTISFGALFNLVFASLCLTTLQVVLAFYGSRQSRGNAVLYGVVVGISIVKLVISNVVRIRASRVVAPPKVDDDLVK